MASLNPSAQPPSAGEYADLGLVEASPDHLVRHCRGEPLLVAQRGVFVVRLSAGLPVTEVPIDHIAEFDQDCWFDGRGATCRQLAEHARRIGSADLAYPVILSANGALMDGATVSRRLGSWAGPVSKLCGSPRIGSQTGLSTTSGDEHTGDEQPTGVSRHRVLPCVPRYPLLLDVGGLETRLEVPLRAAC